MADAYRNRVGEFINKIKERPIEMVENHPQLQPLAESQGRNVTNSFHKRFRSIDVNIDNKVYPNVNMSVQDDHFREVHMKYSAANLSDARKGQSKNPNCFDVALRTSEGWKFAPSTKQRVEDYVMRNSFLDSSPTKIHEGTSHEKIMNLRPRQVEKEIHENEFRYQAKSNAEKVIDSFKQRYPMNSATNKDAFAPHLTKHGMFKKNLEYVQKRDKCNKCTASLEER